MIWFFTPTFTTIMVGSIIVAGNKDSFLIDCNSKKPTHSS